ncbi:uncharacterized protein LOC106143566 isoform X1 [Amyelois transitella]|uniref:uncharacterized protein LOC106143566 isoform X1 n=1 Tax=Amyelois transitella TaxID=680683 RepID=UPI00298F430E|nr:uncharacterized protein LOC106143566 isoform X1 [Amyelois transitella]XP_060801159.1 uncharacterized protein LOC106143566 isoform X1 [Amyelois transitella]
MEALERRGVIKAIFALFFIFWPQCPAADAYRNATKMSYVCPPHFVRLGHSCYYFSDAPANWQEALFACKDRDSNLSVPARWEDRNLRAYLNRPDVANASRWIGGIYDFSTKAWKWGGELRQMHYQSFSKMKKLSPEQLKWHCIAMLPDILYRWAPRSCFEHHRYICQTKLRKVAKKEVKELRKRWQRMGKLNEITAPSVSREDNNINDVDSFKNPKSFDLRPSPLKLRPRSNRTRTYRTHPHGLRPNELRKRSRSPNIHRRLTRPFPGYQWKRRDPQGSYEYNKKLLLSGRTGLTQQQIKSHLTRLAHLRDVQIAKQRRFKDNDWLVNEPQQKLAQTHARTYTMDNNISALHPKTIVEEFDMFPAPEAVPRQSER